MAAPRLLVNGTILTMVAGAPTAEALAIRDGRITAVGATAAVLRLREAGTEVLDLGGRTVLPGFVDPHNHFAVGVFEGDWTDCRDLTSVPAIQAALRTAAAAAPAGEWVRAVGYHHGQLGERRHPTRAELDEAVADRPAFLLHFSHHQGVANSRALAAAGIARATPDPPGGEIGRDRAGEPTGLLYERAMAFVERASRVGRERHFVEASGPASRRYVAVGLTTIQDAAVGPAMERRYAEAEAAGRLAIRVERMALSDAGWFEPPWERAREPGHGRTLKVFVDGGYRCAMRLPREGQEVESGFLFYRPGELADLLVTAWGNDWRVTAHAIGNRGVETGLTAIEAALLRHPRGEGRIRMDHAMFLTPGLIRRIRALGLLVVSQPSFLYDQGPPGIMLPPDLRCRPFGSLRAAGVPQAFSSDYPCGSLAPLVGVYAAATRRTRAGEVVDGEEALPVAAALAAYTIDAARAIGIERECGSLEPGKRADLVVLDANPLGIPPDDLLGIGVARTLVAGRDVFPWAGRLGNFRRPRRL